MKRLNSVCALLFFCALLGSFSSQATVRDYDIETGRSTAAELESNLFNESINTWNGALQLSHRDIIVPGNNGLDIAINRVYSSIQPRQFPGVTPYGFGWTISFGRVVASSLHADKICSQQLWAKRSSDNPSLEFSDGGRQLLFLSSTFADGTLITESNWRMSCVSNIPVVRSPSGLTITMGKVHNTISERSYYATKIENPQGDFLTVEYGEAGSLVYIKSVVRNSDDAIVEFKYKNASSEAIQLDTITAFPGENEHQQKWTYEYEQFENYLTSANKLVRVKRPDNKFWEYDYYDINPDPDDILAPYGPGSYSVKSVTYPYGAEVEYTYKKLALDPQSILNVVSAVHTKSVTNLPDATKVWTYNYFPASKRLRGANLDTGQAETDPQKYSYMDLTVVDAPPGFPRNEYYHLSIGNSRNHVQWLNCHVGKLYQHIFYDDALAVNPIGGMVYGSRLRKISNEQIQLSPSRNKHNAVYSCDKQTTILSFNPIFRRDKDPQKGDDSIANFHAYSRVIEFDGDGNGDGVADGFGLPKNTIESVRTYNSRNFHGNNFSNSDFNLDTFIKTFTVYSSLENKNSKPWVLGLKTYENILESDQKGRVSGSPLHLDAWNYNNIGQPVFHLNGGLNETFIYDTDYLLSQYQVGSSSNPVTEYRNWRYGTPTTTIFNDYDGEAYRSYSPPNKYGQPTEAKVIGKGSKESYSYDALNRLDGITYAQGNAVSIDYGTNSITTSRGGMKIVETLDGLGRVTKKAVTGAGTNANVVYTFKYDLLGRLVFASYPNSSNGTAYTYDAFGRVLTAVEPQRVVTNEYSGVGVYTKEEFDGVTNHIVTRNTLIGVDVKNPVVMERIYIKNSPTDQTQSVGYGRDALGRLRSVSAYTFDGARHKVGDSSTFELDSFGRIVTSYTPEEGHRYFEYDQAGRLSKKYEGTDNKGDLHWDYQYDGLGRLSTVTEGMFPGGIPTRFEYNFDELFKETNLRTGLEREYHYDHSNNLEREILRPGTTGTIANQGVLNKTYEMSYTYSGNDALETITYPDGTVIDYMPDSLGRPTQASRYASNVEYYSHGAVESYTLGNGTTKELGYTELLQPSFLTTRNGIPFIVNSQAYFGDRTIKQRTENSRLTAPEDIGGTFTYQYDTKKRLRFMTQASSDFGSFGYEAKYNAREDITFLRSDLNQSSYNYNYDPNTQRLMSVGDRAYQYNDFGSLVSRKVTTENGNKQYTQSFVPSPASGLIYYKSESITHATQPEETASVQHEYTYDVQSRRVTRWLKHGFTWLGNRFNSTMPEIDITFYGMGNKLLFSENLRGCANTKTAYIYLDDEIIAERKTAGYAPDMTMDLDNNGKGDCDEENSGNTSTRLEWQGPLWEQLTIPSIYDDKSLELGKSPAVNKQAQSSIAPFGIFALLVLLINYCKSAFKRVVGESLRLLCWLPLAIGLVTADAQAETIEETITYMHTDISGSVKAASDENGNLLWRQVYQPYGHGLVKTDQTLAFNQQELDSDSGLIAMGARYYDPEIGRFLTPDPVSVFESVQSNPKMLNRYAYANNNPLSYYDPDGRTPDPLTLGFFAHDVGNLLVQEIVYVAAVINGDSAVADMAMQGIIDTRADAAMSTVDIFNPTSLLSKAGRVSGVPKSGGRSGKQARLKELGDDPKLGKADRGWIKQEKNSIARGNRKTIRNPPGKDLAHERGREAAKGYGYEHSNLQDRKLHRLQHKYDNFGRKNKERPPR